MRSLRYAATYIVKWVVIASVVGAAGGIAAVILRTIIEQVARHTVFLPLWLAPAVGGLLVMWICFWDFDAAGFGTDRYIVSVNRRHGDMRRKTAFTKLAATGITLGFRGSGGVEGPMVVIGGSIANVIDHVPGVRRLLSDHDRRILTICGAAGSIGAVFHSPLAGGIFAVEVLYRSSLHYADLFPAMLSSSMGFVAYGLLRQAAPLFSIPDYIPDVGNVPYFLLAGVVSGFASLLFVRVFSGVSGAFRRLPRSGFHPVMGGLGAGLVLVLAPDAAGIGIDVIQDLIFTVQPVAFLLMLLIVKILATAFTIGSGGSAGLVIPALFIGAVCGNVIAGVLSVEDPGLVASLVISGMAASLAGVANVPVSAAVLLVEMVGLRLGVPATLGAVTGYVIGKGRVIYGDAYGHDADFLESRAIQDLDRSVDH